MCLRSELRLTGCALHTIPMLHRMTFCSLFRPQTSLFDRGLEHNCVLCGPDVALNGHDGLTSALWPVPPNVSFIYAYENA